MVDRSDAGAFMGKTFEEAARLRALHAGSSPEEAAELARTAMLAAEKAKQRLAEKRAQKVDDGRAELNARIGLMLKAKSDAAIVQASGYKLGRPALSARPAPVSKITGNTADVHKGLPETAYKQGYQHWASVPELARLAQGERVPPPKDQWQEPRSWDVKWRTDYKDMNGMADPVLLDDKRVGIRPDIPFDDAGRQIYMGYVPWPEQTVGKKSRRYWCVCGRHPHGSMCSAGSRAGVGAI
jgi:hypothetical protein